ncbi:GNAT family N-acetyltransferase [Lysobacter panacisoli]|uniref:GNAT family N-acetyltransferase n=1 Tax=Lysobacter panacisoli TaxID=1255263 RepID=A0ABP9LA95_9GAMM|nr:GNAT family N-acetyltransferase [Lysobacter panacisoli]
MATARILRSLSEVTARQWDALHDGRNPFVAHTFLEGLERHGCLRAQWGWSPHHLTLWDGEDLIAAAPAYRKEKSHGEFVFDHAWAHAYERNGLDYFPKWLCAAPYSPVTGPRLLARTPEARRLLIAALAELCTRDALSSVHVNFHEEREDGAFDDAWLSRIDVQYHWRNDRGWRDFDDYLAAFDHKHRKNIRQERAKVARAGVTLHIAQGEHIDDEDLAAMHGFYRHTFAEYGNHPALTLSFLHHLRETMPQALVIVLARRGDRPIAGALCLRGGDTLYGRYWGAHENVPGLHFEACYYQGIDYCLRNGLARFEPGAQGEHKLARGFLPTVVRSRHWIAHDGFREALRDWCAQESEAIRRYAATLDAHSPFKASRDTDGA